MAERQTPTPERGGRNGVRQQTPYRDSGERRSQPPHQGGGERRPQPPYQGGEQRRSQPPYQGGGERRSQSAYQGGGERRSQPPYQGGEQRRQPPRRHEVIRCENCGEDYSVTYKRCPFCDERPGRGGISGKRVANTRGGGYGRPASTLKIATWVASFIVVCFAMVIVYRFMGSPLFGGKAPGGTSGSHGDVSGSSDTSTSVPGSTSGDPGTSGSTPDPSGSTPDPVLPPPSTTQGTVVNAGSGLNIRSGPSRDSSVVATASNGMQVTVLGEENGWYQIRYGGDKTGYVSKEFVSTSDAPVAPDPEPDPGPADPNPGLVTSGTQGTIINAENGLNIRSGPGQDNPVVASASNGVKVTILGEENGWYQIRYNGSSTGYVSKEFVSIG